MPPAWPQRCQRHKMRFQPGKCARGRTQPQGHLPARVPVHSVRGSRMRLRPLLTYAPCDVCCVLPRDCPVASPVLALLHSKLAAIPGQSRKRVRAVHRRAHRKIASWLRLDALVRGTAFAVEQFEPVCEIAQAFGVADEEVAFWIETARKFFHQPLLLWFVKIHHYIAAENDVVMLRQVFGLKVVKVEMDKLFYRLLYGVALPHFVEVAQAIAIVHRGHLAFRVTALLARAQNGIVKVTCQDFNLPGTGNERLRPGQRRCWVRPKLTIVECVGNQHCDGIWFLPRGTSCTPYAQKIFSSFPFPPQDFSQNVNMKEIDLCFVAEEAGFIDREVFQQL